jgi:hypothetical protein
MKDSAFLRQQFAEGANDKVLSLNAQPGISRRLLDILE